MLCKEIEIVKLSLLSHVQNFEQPVYDRLVGVIQHTLIRKIHDLIAKLNVFSVPRLYSAMSKLL